MNDHELTDEEEEELMYPCPKCEKRFRTQLGLNWHVKKSHRNNYGCVQCGRLFLTHRALSMHCISLHRSSMIEYNKCDQCERRFIKKVALALHCRNSHSRMSHISSTSEDGLNDQEVTETAKEKLYPCPQCEKEYTTQEAVNLHVDIFHGVKCDQCGKYFLNSRALAIHCRRNHSRVSRISSTGKDVSHDQELTDAVEEEWYSCPQCKEQCRTRAAVTLHLNVFHGGMYKCDECESRFISKRALKKHCKQIHSRASDNSSTSEVGSSDQELTDGGEKEWYSCPQCEKRFRTQGRVTLHFNKYHGVRYKCDQCKTHFMSKQEFTRHCRRSHSRNEFCGGKYKCHRCNRRFMSKRRLTLHRWRIHSRASDSSHDQDVRETVQGELYLCPQCGEQFRREATMNCHLKKFHRDDYKCDECGKQCTSNEAMAIHMRTHAKASDNSAASKYGSSDEKLTDCERQFRMHLALNWHDQKLKVDKEEELMYPCPQCESQFLTQLSLNWHMKKLHSGKYNCEDCGKQCLNNGALTMHKRTHSKASDKSSVRKASLSRGLSNEKLTETAQGNMYSYPHCEKKYTTQLSVNSHVKKYHGGKYKCDECGIHFLSNLTLASHRRSHLTAGKKPLMSTDSSKDREITASRREISATDHEISATGHEIMATGYDIMATDREISATSHEISAIGHEITATGYDIMATRHEISATDEELYSWVCDKQYSDQN